MKKLSNKQMRVEIAKDVIKQLKAKRFKAANGIYFYGDKAFQDRQAEIQIELLHMDNGGYYDDYSNFVRVKEDAEKREALMEEFTTLTPKKCEVCAIGSVFVSAFMKYDELDFHLAEGAFAGNDFKMVEYLGAWFDNSQLRLMETAFEGTTNYSAGNTQDELDRAFKFHTKVNTRLKKQGIRKSKRAEGVLLAVMKNVVRNDGTFKP